PAGRSVRINKGRHRWRKRREFLAADHDARFEAHDLDVEAIVLSKLVEFVDDLLESRGNAGRTASYVDGRDGGSIADQQLNRAGRQPGGYLHGILFDNSVAA